jgi:carbonic anhydrase/acetyltransferase-like protein (isoleucine patch superfamily)
MMIRPYRGILPTIAKDVFIAETAVVIGDVVIGAESNIWFGTIVRGDVHAIRIGARTNIQDGSIVHVTRHRFGCTIGSGVTIGHAAVIHACTLEDNCFIGMSATIMDGARVESGAMVAAGALVTSGKVVKSGELWAGSPARFLRRLTDEELAFFPESAANYVALAREYRESSA